MFSREPRASADAFLGHQNIHIFGCAFGSVRVDRHAAHDGIGDASFL
jgi:hypothetical protein